MRSAIVTGLTAVGFALFGWVMPMVFPKLLPDVAKGFLVVALTLLVVSLILWIFDRNETKIEIESASPINQSHSGQGHNIVADAVHFAPPRFELTANLLEQVAASLRPGEPVIVGWSHSRRSPEMGETIKAFLIAKGFEIGGTLSGGMSFIDPIKPLSVFPNGLGPPGIAIAGGFQAVFVDASIVPEVDQ